MNEYMLILHDPVGQFDDVSPSEMQTIIEQYGAWAGSLAERGRHAGGKKLTEDAGRHLQCRDGETTVVDGPYAEAKEVVGGYFMIKAESYDDAEAIARECPHLAHGGRIEIRQIDQV